MNNPESENENQHTWNEPMDYWGQPSLNDTVVRADQGIRWVEAGLDELGELLMKQETRQVLSDNIGHLLACQMRLSNYIVELTKEDG